MPPSREHLRVVGAAILAVVAGSSSSLFCAESFRGFGILDKTIIRKMSDYDFKQWAKRLLHPEDIRLGKVRAYPTRSERVLAGSTQGDHCQFEQRASSITANQILGTHCPAVQEALKFGQTITFRSVTRDCQKRESLLVGTENPLKKNIEGTELKILYMSFLYDLAKYKNSKPGVLVFAEVPKDKVTKSITRTLVEDLRHTARSLPVAAYVRSDPYFFNVCQFPLIYSFGAAEVRFPAKQEYLEGEEMFCSIDSKLPISCFRAIK